MHTRMDVIGTIGYTKNDNHQIILLIFVFNHSDVFTRDCTICTTAAKMGNIACLRYAYQNGCSWGGTCIAAVENGMLECLIFAHENGCPWDRYCLHIITMNE